MVKSNHFYLPQTETTPNPGEDEPGSPAAATDGRGGAFFSPGFWIVLQLLAGLILLPVMLTVCPLLAWRQDH